MKISNLQNLSNLNKDNFTIINNEYGTNKGTINSFTKSGFPCFYKNKINPETRSFSANYKFPSHITSDDTLYFLNSELGPGNFEIMCQALFTGGPPIALINEPAVSPIFGIFYTQPKTYKLSKQNNSIISSNEIINLQSINDAYTDSAEPMTYYEYDPSAYGYFVEIKITVNSYDLGGPGTVGGSHMVGPTGGLPGIFFRWACSVIGQETTIEGGVIIAKKIN